MLFDTHDDAHAAAEHQATATTMLPSRGARLRVARARMRYGRAAFFPLCVPLSGAYMGELLLLQTGFHRSQRAYTPSTDGSWAAGFDVNVRACRSENAVRPCRGGLFLCPSSAFRQKPRGEAEIQKPHPQSAAQRRQRRSSTTTASRDASRGLCRALGTSDRNVAVRLRRSRS